MPTDALRLTRACLRATACVTACFGIASSCARPATKTTEPSEAARVLEQSPGPVTPVVELYLEPEEVERRIATIDAELAQLGPGHPWAGRYGKSGSDSSLRLPVAPNSGFAELESSGAGRRVLACGKSKFEAGRLVLEAEHLYEAEGAPMRAYICASWGERRYLIPDREDDLWIVEFCNRVNSGREVAEPKWSPWLAISRTAPVTGVPNLPSPYDRWILEAPRKGRVLSASESPSKNHPLARTKRVVLDIGAKDGAFVGMTLYLKEWPKYLDLDVVHDDTSEAEWGDTAAQVGVEFSTRSTKYR